MSNLLLDSYPIIVIPELACAVGLNEAIVLQQIHYWCNINKKAGRNYKGGYYWVYNSYNKWQKQFPWWCERTIKTIFSNLERKGLLVSANYNKLSMDRTKWYRINYDALETLVGNPSCNICTMDSEELAQHIPENTHKTNNGNKVGWTCEEKKVEQVRNIEETNCKQTGSKGDAHNLPPARSLAVEQRDEGIKDFIEWYFQLYEETYMYPHPNLKSSQNVKVSSILSEFINENNLEIDDLKEMAFAFFDNVESDHNINHFATPGILMNRYYEVIY